MTHIRTKTGSLYAVDQEARTWYRLEHTEKSGTIRTSGGVYKQISDMVIGRPLRILAEPLTPGASFRLIQTSLVVEIVQKMDGLGEKI